MFNCTYLVFLAFFGEKNVGVLTFFYKKEGILVFVLFTFYIKDLYLTLFNDDPKNSW